MAVNIRGRSFLKLLDYTPAEIRYLLPISRPCPSNAFFMALKIFSC